MDAVIVGSGPNGLAAAITLAAAGRSVLVLEAAETVGGGVRSAELTLPGFIHDVCSAVHPLGVASPFFRSLDLRAQGLDWITPLAALAHPLDDGTAVLLDGSVAKTAARLGRDAGSYARLVGPLAADWEGLLRDTLGPLRPPRSPLTFARFGLPAMLPAGLLARRAFRGAPARALFAGLAAHSMLALSEPFTSAFSLILAVLGHAVGWPVARGGSGQVSEALAAHLRSLGGEIITGYRVTSMADIPPARVVLFDVGPRQVAAIAGDRLPAAYVRRLRGYRYGPGVFILDYALDGPIPWRADGCRQAATVHLGGALEEIEAAEAAVTRGEHPERPFVILAQPSLFDPTRAPKGQHTAWAYCHVPNGSTEEMAARVEAQIERFAPGFGDRVRARRTRNCLAMEAHNPNYVGGDINGGRQDWRQLFTRPVAGIHPYATPATGLYLCSSSTPPGGGVHGMCGYHAAQTALRSAFG